MSPPFDTLQYVKDAETVGIKREHAEYQAQQLSKIIDSQIVTKQNMASLEKSVTHDMKHLEKHVDHKISELTQQIIITEHKLMFRLGGLMIVCSGIITAILGCIIKI